MKNWGLMLVLAMLAWTSKVQSQDCCDHCGCHSCRKVCRVVCDTKKVPHTTYTCECEDFCVPKRSQRDGCTCEVDCNGCEKCKPNYVPTCATVHTKKKLVKHVEQKEVKTYKFVVAYLCDDCCRASACEAGTGAAPATTANESEEQFSPPAPPAGSADQRRVERNVKPVTFLESIFRSK